jgi:trehalose-6-phosphate synthase
MAAIDMPSEEARVRMAAIRATVESSDVRRWAADFLRLLEDGDHEPGWAGPSAA